MSTFVDGEAGFKAFVAYCEPRLRNALMATYGTERGREATAEALAACWERWEEVRLTGDRVGVNRQFRIPRRHRQPRA